MHATQELIVVIHDSRIAAGALALIAFGLAVYGVLLLFSRTTPGKIPRYALAAGGFAALLILPGRFMQVRRAQVAYGTRDERDAHNALRLLISAQEDYRIRNGQYASSVDLLRTQLLDYASPNARLAILSADSVGWAGQAQVGRSLCASRVSSASFLDAHTHNFLDDDVQCATSLVAASRQLSVPARQRSSSNSETHLAGEALGGAWVQERADAERSGIVSTPAAPVSWDSRVGGSVRAVASIIDGLVLVGTHGTGWLGALELKTGRIVWHTRAPNWIHQNPLAAFGTVVVGLGDKDRVMAGDPVGLGIGGVAAYDLHTGALRWFGRSNAAVMTAPVIWKRSVISADGAGNLESRDLGSGKLNWRRGMPGYSVMASPALRDSTVFIGLGHRFLCAYSANSGREQWCYQAPRAFRIGGDPTPSVIGETVYWSASYDSTGLEMLLHGTSGRNYITEKLTGKPKDHSSQWLFAINARDGRERWRRELGGGYDPQGNMAGSAVSYRDLVLIIAPRARRLFAIDTASGTIRWSRQTEAFSRGAVTIVDSLAITTDAAKHLHILRADDGRDICSGVLSDAPDRSGPTIAGRTVLFTGLGGLVFARPLDAVLRCAMH
jgi:outer membrane protein assembly factor BamB